MPKPTPSDPPPGGFCTYASVKLDDEVLPFVRAAAALSGDVTTQEWLSDVALTAAAKLLNRKPIKRRPAPPKPHGKGRPPSAR
jgi:hypothetical protein